MFSPEVGFSITTIGKAPPLTVGVVAAGAGAAVAGALAETLTLICLTSIYPSYVLSSAPPGPAVHDVSGSAEAEAGPSRAPSSPTRPSHAISARRNGCMGNMLLRGEQLRAWFTRVRLGNRRP